MSDAKIRYFLGANTPMGFKSYFSYLTDSRQLDRLYILKGGPGTGKSSIMKKIAAAAEQRGLSCQYIHCSSDPDSLDGIYLKEIRTAMLDGTAPHTLEPALPGAFEELVYLSDCWDKRLLRLNLDEIRKLSEGIYKEHKRCIGYMTAVRAVDNDSFSLISDYCLREKIYRYASRLTAKHLPRKGMGEGRDERRFLSVVAPGRVASFAKEASLLCEQSVIIEDPHGLASSILLGRLRTAALERGIDTVSCCCVCRPDEKLEHLIMPELSLGFFTSNHYHPISSEHRLIHARRFIDRELEQKKFRLGFNSRARAELIDEACIALGRAKLLHDMLERIYVQSMNFELVDEKIKRLTAEILSI